MLECNVINNYYFCLLSCHFVVVNLFLLYWANVWCNDTNEQIEKLLVLFSTTVPNTVKCSD